MNNELIGIISNEGELEGVIEDNSFNVIVQITESGPPGPPGPPGPTTWGGITDKPTNLETVEGSQAKANQAEQNAKDYTDQEISNIDIPDSTWESIQNKPDTFTPSEHNHTIGNITGLQNELNSKETPSGAQAKADAAEQNAKDYTDSELANFEGMVEHGNDYHTENYATEFDLVSHKADYEELVDKVTELSYIVQRYTASVKPKPADSWQKVQDIVRSGLGDKVFRIGDQFVATYAGVEHTWDVIGINHDKPTDKSKNYSLTIQSRDILLNTKINESEALYYAEVELPAGDYHFINRYESNKPYHFTLTKAIPVGGIIFISAWSTNTPTQIKTFADKITTTAIETLSLTEGSTGTQLTPINDIRRCQYGSNNYMESAIRQWLNSESDLFNWESKTRYDMPPIGLPYTGAGFLNLLDSDLAKVIGAVDKQVARNTITDGGGQDLFSDKVFLLSRVEIYSGEEGVIDGEVPYDYYSSMEGAPTTSAADWRIKYLDLYPRNWWMRSPTVGASANTRFVGATGAVGSSYATSSFGVSPACVII